MAAAHPTAMRLTATLTVVAWVAETAFLAYATSGAVSLARHAPRKSGRVLRVAAIARLVINPLSIAVGFANREMSAWFDVGRHVSAAALSLALATVAWSLAAHSTRVRVGARILALIALGDLVASALAAMGWGFAEKLAAASFGICAWILLPMLLRWVGLDAAVGDGIGGPSGGPHASHFGMGR